MYKELSDADLILRMRQCDDEEKKEIVQTLYDRYKLLVLKVCYHYLADYELTNDVFHDVIIKIIEKAQAIKDPSSFKSWVLTISRNLCVDYLRRTSYLKEVKPLTAEIEISYGDRTEDRYIAEMDRQKILRHLSTCIQRLDEYDLNVFKLRWQGLRAAQIINILKTDRTQLRRCYDAIKKTLEACMKSKGLKISIDRIISLGEIDE